MATSINRAPSLVRARDMAVPATRKGQNIGISPFGDWRNGGEIENAPDQLDQGRLLG
jgi:hypothetical protein